MADNENTPAAATPAQVTTPVAGQAPAAEAQVEDKPKYTDKQLNDLIAKESAKRSEGARAALLRNTGSSLLKR